MNGSARTLLLLLVAASLGLVWLNRAFPRQGRARSPADDRDSLQTRVKEMKTQAVEFRRRLRDLETERLALSNRVVEAEGRCAQERGTQEPLRRQIEAMLDKQFSITTAVQEKEKELERRRDALAKASKEAAVLGVETRRAAQTIDELKEKLTQAEESGKRLRDLLDESEGRAARTENLLAAVQSRLTAAERDREAARLERERLAKEARAAQEQADRLKADLASQKTRSGETAAQHQAVSAELSTVRRAQEKTKAELDALRQQNSRLTEELRTLRETQKKGGAAEPVPDPPRGSPPVPGK
jgi:chromosome segregation ATPase